MAGEIPQDVALALAFGSAAIGACGAIISQVAAGVITNKRERIKADADSRQWRADADAKRRDRQLDRKIELFSEFLSTAREVQSSELWLKGRTAPAARQSQQDAVRKLRHIAEEIGILAPELYEYADAASSTASDAVLRQMVLEMAGIDPDDEVRVEAAKVRQTRKSASIWAKLFRQATRSYISHEPITPYQDALVTHSEDLQKPLRMP